MRHLLDVDVLPDAEIARTLTLADEYRMAETAEPVLAGRHVALLFAEPSTRTRLSFELAARKLGAWTYVLDPGSSSMVKGETLVDTVRNLDALGFSLLVVRHHRAGSAAVAARHLGGGSVVNAGDGWHAHPTQALLDLFTLQSAFGGVGSLRGRKIAIVGDVRHSRVARSNVWTLSRAGMDVWLSGPAEWLRGSEELPARATPSLDEALDGAEAVMGLRVQKERMAAGVSVAQYVDRYQLTEERLARAAAPGCRFLHPGPINEGVEVTRAVARGPRSLVLEQARNGVPVRMAVLASLVGPSSTGSSAAGSSAAGSAAAGSAAARSFVSQSLPEAHDPTAPTYKGEPLDAERGPGLGCFWIQVGLFVVLLVLTPLSVWLAWDSRISAVLLLVTLGLLFFVGQTTIFLLRLVAADRRSQRRPLGANARKTVGQIEDEAARADRSRDDGRHEEDDSQKDDARPGDSPPLT